jgi:hypothetical protein
MKQRNILKQLLFDINKKKKKKKTNNKIRLREDSTNILFLDLICKLFFKIFCIHLIIFIDAQNQLSKCAFAYSTNSW